MSGPTRPCPQYPARQSMSWRSIKHRHDLFIPAPGSGCMENHGRGADLAAQAVMLLHQGLTKADGCRIKSKHRAHMRQRAFIQRVVGSTQGPIPPLINGAGPMRGPASSASAASLIGPGGTAAQSRNCTGLSQCSSTTQPGSLQTLCSDPGGFITMSPAA
jgi:hypothetical protein